MSDTETRYPHSGARPAQAVASRCRRLSRGLLVACLSAGGLVHAGVEPKVSPLIGTVTDADQEPMEGVVVIARAEGSTVLTAVTSGPDGRFAFPAQRLQPGEYAITVRAAGFELSGDGERQVAVAASAPARLSLSLSEVDEPSQLASQLTSLGWVNSFPGSEAQKSLLVRNMVNCGFCHTLERVARSAHSASDFLSVIQRMKQYETDHSSAERIQIVAPPEPLEGLMWYGRKAQDIADYLATINLSAGRGTWDYPLKPLPRPTGEGTRAVVTVFPIPRQPSVIHDLDVDSQGNVWYGNTGWDYIGRLNPETGTFSEWEAPNFHPVEPAPGTQRIVGVQDIQVDPQDRVWVAVGGNKHAMFDPDSGRWRIFDLPVVWKNPFLSPVREGNQALWATGLRHAPDASNPWPEAAYRLDIESGKLSAPIDLFGALEQPEDPDRADQMNYCYMMDQDRDGNFLCTVPEGSGVARADASGKVTFTPTPTPHAYPRRGRLASDNRFWFSEFFADQLAVIDLESNEITEYPLGIDFISPYYAHPDGKGRVWASSTGSDRLLRFTPDTGELVQYLMPVYYDARKIVVVDEEDRTTIWIPNKNTAQLIRVEVPD